MANPVIGATEWTTNLAHDATQADVQNALNALPSVSGVTVFKIGDVYHIFFPVTSPLAGENIVPFLVGYPTSGTMVDVTIEIKELYPGASGVALTPYYQMRFGGTPSTGTSFRLGYQPITTPRTELQIAMMWVDDVLRNDTVINALIEPAQYGSMPAYTTYIAADRLPYIDVNVTPSGVELNYTKWVTGFVYAQAKSSDYSASISGARAWSTVFLSIEMQAKTSRYDKRLQAGGLQIDNLFNQKQGEVVTIGGTTYGTILSSDRVSEINTSSVNSKSEAIYRQGGVFEIDVKKAE